jgi:hypothetical protein
LKVVVKRVYVDTAEKNAKEDRGVYPKTAGRR